MLEKQASCVLLVFFLAGTLALATRIRPVAAAPLHIRILADGSIEAPSPTHGIQRDGDTYTLSADIEGTITVERDNITIDGRGHRLWGTGGFSGFDLNGRTGVTIRRTNIDSFFNGIRLVGSDGNNIHGNNITNSWYGIWFSASNSNRFFHNNFVANADHAYMDTLCCNSSNFWDNGVEGNYWDNYIGTDSDRDGLGTAPYNVAILNIDERPLMGPFHEFTASAERSIDVVSNSTIRDFQYVEHNSTIKLRVVNSTASQEYGFIRVRIPLDLVAGSLNVTVNGANPVFWDYSVHADGDNRWVYFSYEHSELEVVIVPEFPSTAVYLLLGAIGLLAILLLKEKHPVA